MAGANLPRISQDALLKFPIPTPPMAEQERIVKLLDEADELRKLRAQADRRTSSLIPALFHDMFGDPSVNTRRWKVVAISEMAEVQGGLQLTPLRDTYPLKRPYLRVANVQRGFLVLDEIKEIGLLDSEYERVTLAKDDLLLVEGNGNPREVGRAAIWDGSVKDCVHQNHLIRVRPRGDLLTSDYLLEFVNSESGRSYFHGSEQHDERACYDFNYHRQELPNPHPTAAATKRVRKPGCPKSVGWKPSKQAALATCRNYSNLSSTAHFKVSCDWITN